MEKKKLNSVEFKSTSSGPLRAFTESNGAIDASGGPSEDLHTKRHQQHRPIYTVDASDFPRIQQICLKIDENFKKSVFSIKHPDYKTPFRNFADVKTRLLPYHLLGFEQHLDSEVASLPKFKFDSNKENSLERICKMLLEFESEYAVVSRRQSQQENLYQLIATRFSVEYEKSQLLKIKNEYDALVRIREPVNFPLTPSMKQEESRPIFNTGPPQQQPLSQHQRNAFQGKQQLRPIFSHPYMNPAAYAPYYAPAGTRPHGGFVQGPTVQQNSSYGGIRPSNTPAYPFSSIQQIPYYNNMGNMSMTQIGPPFSSEGYYRPPHNAPLQHLQYPSQAMPIQIIPPQGPHQTLQHQGPPRPPPSS